VKSAERAVLLDIGGVLVPDFLHGVVDDWAARLGLDRDEVVTAIYRGSDQTVLIGALCEDEWWREVERRLPVSSDDMLRLAAALDAAEKWDEELVAFARSLRARTRTAIVSNAWPSQRDRIEARGLSDVTDVIILSCEAGCAKPASRIFEIALQALGVPPERSLFVDDNPNHVNAAVALGMTGHVHVDATTTIAVVEDFLVQCRDASRIGGKIG
jgi:putative hydrolase of the HAD superfamily